MLKEAELPRKSLFWGKANAWYYFKPGMSRIPFIKLERKLIGGLLTWLLVTAVICWDFKTIFLSYSLLVLLQLWSSADFTQPSHDAEGAIGMYSASTLLLPMLPLVRLLPVINAFDNLLILMFLGNLMLLPHVLLIWLLVTLVMLRKSPMSYG